MADEFLTTRWSLVFAAGSDGPGAAAALEHLCRDAWRPLYAFARRWGCSQEDAEDAVQGFIASLLARDSISKIEPGRGHFRTFLLAGMRNHMSDLAAHARRQKRGGGAEHVSFEGDSAERGYVAMGMDAESPERAFDRAWAMAIMEKARAQLEAECAASGKADLFAELFPETNAADVSGYAGISERLGISETALRTIAMRLRRRWRDLIRAELAQTVSSEQALEEEMDALRQALR